MYQASMPIGTVATIRSDFGSMRTRSFVSPLPAHTVPLANATAFGRSQFRMRKSPCGVWWIDPDSHPTSPVGSPTFTFAIWRFVRGSILPTVPSPELPTQPYPPPNGRPAGFVPVAIVVTPGSASGLAVGAVLVDEPWHAASRAASAPSAAPSIRREVTVDPIATPPWWWAGHAQRQRSSRPDSGPHHRSALAWCQARRLAVLWQCCCTDRHAHQREEGHGAARRSGARSTLARPGARPRPRQGRAARVRHAARLHHEAVPAVPAPPAAHRARPDEGRGGRGRRDRVRAGDAGPAGRAADDAGRGRPGGG